MHRSTEELARAEVDALLEIDYEGACEDTREKIATAVKEAYRGCSAQAWTEVTTRFAKAFHIDGEDTERAFVPVFGTTPPRDTSAYEATLVEITKGTWFGRYLEYTDPSEAPPQFHLGSILATCAAGCGRRPLIDWEARRTYPNLFVLLIGPTGARKGSAIEMAEQFAEAAGCTKLPGEGTPQGIVEALRLRQETTMRDADGLMVVHEFRVLLSKDDKNKRDSVVWLTDLYDSPDYMARALMSKPGYEVRNVCLSLLAASNMAWLRLVPNDAVEGGFFPRWLLFGVEDEFKRWRANPRFDATLKGELLASLKERMRDIPERMGITKETEAYLAMWYEKDVRAQYEAMPDEMTRAWLTRKMPQVLKVATTWQFVDGGPKDELQVEWVHRARQLVDWTDPWVTSVYHGVGVSGDGEIVDSLTKLLRRKGGMATEAAITRSLSNRYSSERIRQGLRTLAMGRMASATADPAQGMVWALTGVKGR